MSDPNGQSFIDTRWRFHCWLPFLLILAVFAIGVVCNTLLIYPVRPVLGPVEFIKSTAVDLSNLIGAEVAARQRIGIASSAMLVTLLALAIAAAWVVVEVYREFRSPQANAATSRLEFVINLIAFVVLVSVITLFGVYGRIYCPGSDRLFECLGTDVVGGAIGGKGCD